MSSNECRSSPTNWISAPAPTRRRMRAGLLASYGPDYAYVYKRGAYYVDRILKGVKAEDLPIELPAKYLFVLNLRTARALGVSVPRSTLIQADEVIE